MFYRTIYRNNPNDLLMAALGGFALGALAMFIFDPQQGRRRRALARDKIVHAGHEISDRAAGTSKDLGNRAYGLYAETRGVARDTLGIEGGAEQPGAFVSHGGSLAEQVSRR